MTGRTATHRPPLTKHELLAGLQDAFDRGVGYAAGRLSYSHVFRLSYRVAAERLRRPDLFLRDGIARLHFESLNQLGIYPAELGFYPRFDAFWIEHLRALDCVGLYRDRLAPSRRILTHYRVPGPPIDFHDLEPDRSTPSRDGDCYLPLFRDRRVLLICPFAGLLRNRAAPEIFEAVWAKTGKRWFEPRDVQALEFPYGFARTTQRQYPTVLDLFEAIRHELEARRFDVALIAAAGLAVPIAAHVKRLGKVAIDVGGHLQVVFGILGRRWRRWSDWQERYVTEAWIDMPERYRPEETGVCDDGAYW
jgi:hypothetical protein